MTGKEIVQALRCCKPSACGAAPVSRSCHRLRLAHLQSQDLRSPARSVGVYRLAGDKIRSRTGANHPPAAELAVCGGRHMSYDISFKVKVEGVNAYVPVGACDANITWNVRKIIEKSTGLEWKNCQNNGLCVDVIPKIEAGLRRLEQNQDSFKEYEAPNGWGTVEGTIQFFRRIIEAWNDLLRWNEELVPAATFWIE